MRFASVSYFSLINKSSSSCWKWGRGGAVTLRFYLFNGQTFELLNLTQPTFPDSFMQNLWSDGYRLNLGSSLGVLLAIQQIKSCSWELSVLHFNYFLKFKIRFQKIFCSGLKGNSESCWRTEDLILFPPSPKQWLWQKSHI